MSTHTEETLKKRKAENLLWHIDQQDVTVSMGNMKTDKQRKKYY